MPEEVIVTVADEGQMGAALYSLSKPRGCPGLGGWKSHEGKYMTRVKGKEAALILKVSEFAPGNMVTLTLHGDTIKGIEV